MPLFVNAENDVWMDGVTVNGQQLRLQQAGQLLTTASATGTTGIAGRPGVRDAPSSPLLVQASAGMAITVNAGTCWVQGTASATAGMYTACLDTTGTITVAASDPTNPRIDNVIAQITDVGTASSTTVITLQTGTPNASPIAPTLPANSLLLATVAVAATATSITAGNITDKRVFTTGLGGIVKLDTSGGIVGPSGLFAYDINTGRLRVSDGSGNARGVKTVAFTPVTSANNSGVSISSSSYVTVLSASVTTDGVTEIEVRATFPGFFQATPHVGDELLMSFQIDGASVGSNQFFSYTQQGTSTNPTGCGAYSWFYTPSAATHTITWQAALVGTNPISISSNGSAGISLRVSAVPG